MFSRAGSLRRVYGFTRKERTYAFRAHVLSVWRWAVRKKLIGHYPDVPKFKEPKRLPRAKLIDEISAALEACRDETRDVAGVPGYLFWQALILTIYDTGLRIGATMQLQWSGFDPVAETIFIDATTQKQKADQLLPLSPRRSTR